jgi:hypothetical protein
MAFNEKGPWKVIRDDAGEPYVQSDGFKHDVALYIAGDFTDDAEKTEYAEELARRLSAEELARRLSAEELARRLSAAIIAISWAIQDWH